jgi:hypothetical protein
MSWHVNPDNPFQILDSRGDVIAKCETQAVAVLIVRAVNHYQEWKSKAEAAANERVK